MSGVGVGQTPLVGVRLAKRNALILAVVLACAGIAAEARADFIGLKSAQSFAVLGGTGVTNTGPTTIRGDLGLYPGTALGGPTPPVVIGGTVHLGDEAAHQAQLDALAAWNSLGGLTATHTLTGQDLGERTLTPGVYYYGSSAQLTGKLTLDGQNQAAPQFVFQIGSTLTTASYSSIALTNGAYGGNVFFQVGSSATLGTYTDFAGTVIAYASDTLNTGATVDGSVIALTGAVTLDTNDVGGGTPLPATPEPASIALFVAVVGPFLALRKRARTRA